MATFYDEIEIEDFIFEEEDQTYYYPCPCGDQFEISLVELRNGEEIAHCPSCSLLIRVIYDPEDFPAVEEEEEGEVVKTPAGTAIST